MSAWPDPPGRRRCQLHPSCSKTSIFSAAPLHKFLFSHSFQSKASRPCAGMSSNAKMRHVAFLELVCLRYRSQFNSGTEPSQASRPSSLPVINHGLTCKTVCDALLQKTSNPGTCFSSPAPSPSSALRLEAMATPQTYRRSSRIPCCTSQAQQ